ncbi:MAG: hypothetical protein ACIAXF_09940 [Phycisphaerales bacterium JB063]
MSFWEKIKEQEVVDYRLILALPVILVIGVGVLAFTRGGGDTVSSDRQAPGLGDHDYICHFDQTVRTVSAEEVWDLEAKGDAIIRRGGEIPTRIRCPKCNHMSCFRNDLATGEPIEVGEDWDLSENPEVQGGRGTAGQMRQ